jgi:hypothetical protein
MKQTTMQELLEFCEYRLSKASDNNVAAWNMILSKIKDDGLVETEKQQIMDSHNQGYADGYRDNGTSPIEYYNETYKKEIKMKK